MSTIIFRNSCKKIKQMYIAFKWLVSMTLAMWLAMCFTNKSTENHTRTRHKYINSLAITFTFKDNSERNQSFKPAYIKDSKNHSYPGSKEQIKSEYLLLMMFVAGALLLSVLIKKQEQILKFAMGKINLIGGIRKVFALVCVTRLKCRALEYGAAITKYLLRVWVNIKRNGQTMTTIICLYAKRTTNSIKEKLLYNIMLNKLQDIVEERKSLGRLLVTAIQENKKIRTQYQLESLAKNRLSEHIENINKQIKELRSRYATFQHIYLLTHQENIFLKLRIRKLTKEIDDAQKDLVELINKVYKTDNRDLQLFCSRYLVKPKKSSHSMSSDIQIFITNARNKSSDTLTSTSCTSNMLRDELPSPASFPHCSTEILQNKSLVPLGNPPKLKGLPGEYVWTVKDKDGIIEKLYEYDFEPGYDNGETVRKIREYSVYYDKDCLLDFSNSLPEREVNAEASHFKWNEFQKGSTRIVTGSEAFKSFLRNNKSIMPSNNYKTV